MAGGAIRIADDAVVEDSVLPRGRIVAQAALALVVVGRLIFGVAAQTIRDSRMIKERRCPGRCVVAGRALPLEVICRFALQVATDTVRVAGVIERSRYPCRRAVAAVTRTGIVNSGFDREMTI